MEEIASKLQQLEELLGYNSTQMAQLGDISRTTYHRYKNGQSLPSGKFLSTLLKNEKAINSDWLLRDKGSALTPSSGRNGLINIPIYKMNGKDRRGSTMTHKEWEEQYTLMQFNKTFADNIVGKQSYDLIITILRGTASEQFFPEDSVVVIDLDQDRYTFDSYYFTRIGDTYRIFLLQRISPNELIFVGGNKNYQPLRRPLDARQSDPVIKGRVVWVGQKY